MLPKTVIAHRGMSTLAPENTITAFSLCREFNIQWFECDVDIIADATLIIFHDSDLARCCDIDGSVYALTKASLPRINVFPWRGNPYTNEKIPTFSDLIQVVNHQGLSVNIEIKSNEYSADRARRLITLLSAEIRKIADPTRVIISSFNPLLLYDFKKKSESTATALLTGRNALNPDSRVIAEYTDCDYIHPFHGDITRQTLNDLLLHNLKVNVWTVNSVSRANELFNWGVTGVFTNYAKNFRHFLPAKNTGKCP